MYILTNDENEEDCGSLYVSGIATCSWPGKTYLGVDHDCNIPTLVVDRCKEVACRYEDVLVIRNIEGKDELWLWGYANGGGIPKRSEIPVKWDDENNILQDATDFHILCATGGKSYLAYKKDNKNHLLVCGGGGNTAPNGLGTSVSKYTELDFENDNPINKFIAVRF